MKYTILLLALVFSIALSATAATCPAFDEKPEYMILIDAGSTGSRIHVYHVKQTTGVLIPLVSLGEDAENDATSAWYKKMKPGVSSFGPNSAGLESYLNELLGFAREKIPAETDLSKVPIIFQATGGVRALSPEEQNKIIENVTSILERSEFLVETVEILDGQLEGLYAWLTVNYLEGRLSGDTRLDTMGIIDMGGASMQVAFEPDEEILEGGFQLRLGFHTYNVYSHSYSGYGEVAARKSWQEMIDTNGSPNVCEFIRGSRVTDFFECRASINELIKSEHHSEGHGGLDGAYQPKINGPFVGIDNIAETAKVLPSGPFSNAQLEDVGKEICKSTPALIEKKYPKKQSTSDLSRACFDAAYISALFTGLGHDSEFRALGIPHDEKWAHGIEMIGHTPISWTLGSALYYLTQ